MEEQKQQDLENLQYEILDKENLNREIENLKSQITEYKERERASIKELQARTGESTLPIHERNAFKAILSLPQKVLNQIGTAIGLYGPRNQFSRGEIYRQLNDDPELLKAFNVQVALYKAVQNVQTEKQILEAEEPIILVPETKGKEKEKIKEGSGGGLIRAMRQPNGYIGSTLPQPYQNILLNRHYPIRQLILEASGNNPNAFYGIN